jgi:predicted ATPase/class 3 adenylate cyclase
MVEQPSGTVTLVFTDIEGSTRLLLELGERAYREALAEHRRNVREACGRHGGYEVDYEGDSFFYAFSSAVQAMEAVEQAVRALESGPITVRVGVHTGEPSLDPPKYVGLDVHKAARIMAAAHGGQVVISQSTRDLLEPSFVIKDLGEHRLKDLSGPRRLFQFGEGEFPALRTLYRTNLPVPATTFVGREQELGEVTALLRNGVRLLTLTGPGGTGKTRLGLQAVAEVADGFADGVWWVPLASLRDPALVLAAVAQTLEVSEQPGLDLGDTLAEALGGKQMLILFDNAEHLLPEVAHAAARLRDAGKLKVVVTSRERLQLAGEHLYPVPQLTGLDGSALFTVRAGALVPGFEATAAVEDLCSRLDNLPLAIELAAARTTLLTPEQILERLTGRSDLLQAGRDSDPRQQTLRATIEWSYELLDAEERELFARFAVFTGSFTLEAAEEVCAADLDTLQSLVDKSLIRHSGERFWMLETIREYALEKLEVSSESGDARARHAQHFLALAEAVDDEFEATDDRRLVDRLQDEVANLRSALGFYETSDPELALHLATALRSFWAWRSQSEGQGRLEDLLHRAQAAPIGLRVKALQAAGQAAYYRGDYAAAERFAREALALARQEGDEREAARALSRLAALAAARGELAQGKALAQESLDIARRNSDPSTMAHALHVLGDFARRERKHSQAVAWTRQAIEAARAAGNVSVGLASLANLADLALEEGDLLEARRLYCESLEQSHGFGDWITAYGLLGLAATAAALGEPVRAGRLSGAVSAMTEGSEARLFPGDRDWYERFVAKAEGPAFAAGVEEGRAMTSDEAVSYALEARPE